MKQTFFALLLPLALFSPRVFAQSGAWSAHHACSVGCGGGTTYRDCILNGQQVDASNCPGGAEAATSECNTVPCGTVIGTWSAFLACSVRCGGGVQNRNCLVKGAISDPSYCAGNVERPCNTQPCGTITGTWSAFLACSVSCGGGVQTRNCLVNGAIVSPSNCAGSATRPCNTQACNATFPGVWSAGHACPVPCGTGTTYRDCILNGVQVDYSNCEGTSTIPCNTQPCSPPERPIDETFYAALTRRPVATYFPSWISTGSDLNLIDHNFNVVFIAYARPDLIYPFPADPASLADTGLEFGIFTETSPLPDVSVVRQSIQARRHNPVLTLVLLAVGGPTYLNWQNFNAEAVARLALDLGVDGISLDFFLPTDQASLLTDAVVRMRQFTNRPFVLNFAGNAVGAYGQGQWANSQPQNNFTGVDLNLLTNATANLQIDSVFINAFGAGPTFNPLEAYAAFSFYLPGGIIFIGVLTSETGPEQVQALAEAIQPNPLASLGTWTTIIRDPTAAAFGSVVNLVLNPGIPIP